MTYEPRKFACTHCGQHVEAEVSFAGQTVACPCCQQPMRIPAEAAFRRRAAGAGALRRHRWPWVLLVLALGGAAAVYFIPSARQQADAIATTIGLKPATLMIDGVSRPAKLRDWQQIRTDLEATVLPLSISIPAADFLITGGLDGGHGISVNQTFSGVSCTLETLRGKFGEPSRVMVGDEEIPPHDERAIESADWHYYYHTGKTGGVILILYVSKGQASRGRLVGSIAVSMILLRPDTRERAAPGK